MVTLRWCGGVTRDSDVWCVTDAATLCYYFCVVANLSLTELPGHEQHSSTRCNSICNEKWSWTFQVLLRFIDSLPGQFRKSTIVEASGVECGCININYNQVYKLLWREKVDSDKDKLISSPGTHLMDIWIPGLTKTFYISFAFIEIRYDLHTQC